MSSYSYSEDERKETPVLSSLINGTPGPSTIAECSRKTASERNELPQTE